MSGQIIEIEQTRLKLLIQNKTGNLSNPVWIPVKLIHSCSSIEYFIPYFSDAIDMLNYEKTIFAGKDFIVKAHLSESKVIGHHFMALPDLPFTSRLIVTDEVRKEINKNQFTGMNFEKVPSS